MTVERTDDELTTWLAGVKAEQAATESDLYAELWLANVEAKAIKDVTSPASKAAHEEINRIIGRIEAL
jgi:hypothetical protein